MTIEEFDQCTDTGDYRTVTYSRYNSQARWTTKVVSGTIAGLMTARTFALDTETRGRVYCNLETVTSIY